MIRRASWAAATIALGFAVHGGLGAQQPPPDVIYTNGSIITMASGLPTAQAVAIRGDRFVAVGSTAEVRALAGSSTREFDLVGRTAVPGLIDSHTHPISAALSEQAAAIPVMNSIADILVYVRTLADMVVVTKDYLTCPVDKIRTIEAVLTVVGGKPVYARPDMQLREITRPRSAF